MNYNVELEPKNPFYQVTSNDLQKGKGHLIRYEPLTGDAALADARASYRVIYESTSGINDSEGNPENNPIGVSGIIAFPREPARAGGWPVLSWAHGTVGSADISAPSMDPYVEADFGEFGLGLTRNINRAPHKLLNAFLRNGWAVAMTDYEGLGCYGNHPYLLGESEGRGILDIVPVLHELASEETSEPVSDQYVIVGHSQGGQAALFGASLAGSYATPGVLRGVAALAPASNLTGNRKPVTDPDCENGLWNAYRLGFAVEDLSGFYALFTNGVRGGDPDIDLNHIFQPAARDKYLADYDTKSRAEMSDETLWKERPPLALNPALGIFRKQDFSPEIAATWDSYWKQVDNFNPAVEISAPIRISQAEGDTRVRPEKTNLLIRQLREIVGQGPVTVKLHPEGTVAKPVPELLGEHFGLLADPREIEEVVAWAEERLN